MDGFKSKLTNSLQVRLALTTAAAILIVAVFAGVLSYLWAYEEAIELQDEQLIRLSALVNSGHIVSQDPDTPVQVSEADPESHFVVQWLGAPPSKNSDELVDLPHDLPEGLQTLIVDNVSWRAIVKTMKNNSRVVVAQQTYVRDEIAQMSALGALIPLMILIPSLILIVGYLIHQVFLPLNKMTAQLDKRADEDLSLLSENNLALEVSPFVMAINRLLNRVNQSIAFQRKFVRDASHELRSPLTSISLQTEGLINLITEPSIRERLVKLHLGSERARVLIDQLLTLARAQEEIMWIGEPISLKDLLREVLEDLLPLAEIKKIEIDVVGNDITVVSHAMDLHILIKNVIDNAIRYTPDEGHVNIILKEKDTAYELTVKDSGPGIPIEEHQRVFDPFYRILGSGQTGSGLGLSIVKNISRRLGINTSIDLPVDESSQLTNSGLSLCISFPKN